MKKLFTLLAASTALFVTTGCQSGGAYAPKNATKYNHEDSLNLVLMVQRSVTSPGIQETILPDGRMQVVANLRNRETRRIEVQVQCVFKDAQGFDIDSTPWNTLIMTENSQESVRFVSMNNQARRYTVRVRQAH
jgi:uncharacterized protein YcfL